MENRLLTPEELKEITGRTRYSKQAEWFKDAFGIDVVTTLDGRPVMTWTHFNALLARRAGLQSAVEPQPAKRPKLCSPFPEGSKRRPANK